MKNQPNQLFLTLLLILLGINSNANTCANAIQFNLVSCGPVYNSVMTTVGEPASAENPCGLASGTEGVNWYTFTGAGDPVEASTISQSTLFDTRIWIYEGSCGSLNCVGANDNFGGGLASRVSFSTTLGATYYIVVGGTNSAEGQYELSVEGGEPTFGPTMPVTACDSYTAPSGNVYTTSGVYSDTIPNSMGCDSITTIALTIESIDLSVEFTGSVFLSNASGVDYQWIDCATGNPIPGETNATLIPPSNGSYAVILDNGVCSDTSDCISEAVGIDENEELKLLTVSPNPSSGLFTLNSEIINGTVLVYDALGRLIVEEEISEKKRAIDISNQRNGIYTLMILGGQELRTVQIIKM